MSFYFDVTRSASSRQLSGLLRVSDKLMQALESQVGEQFESVVWNSRKRCFKNLKSGKIVEMSGHDVFITPEVFSSKERPGYHDYIEKSDVKSAAVFHDSIPIKYPEITWPKSVSRHPLYMKDLTRFHQVFCVSKASQDDLTEYWNSSDVRNRPSASVLPLGADFFDPSLSDWVHRPHRIPSIVNVGIVEPRKNQNGLLDVAIGLWDGGLKFELNFVGRINPHFGKPIEKKIRRASKEGYSVKLHSKQNDSLLLDLYSKSHFTVFNSIAEGFGLPVVESLWLGIPCICRSLPSLRDLSLGEGCRFFESDVELEQMMSEWILGADKIDRATVAAEQSNTTTWADSGRTVINWAFG